MVLLNNYRLSNMCSSSPGGVSISFGPSHLKAGIAAEIQGKPGKLTIKVEVEPSVTPQESRGKRFRRIDDIAKDEGLCRAVSEYKAHQASEKEATKKERQRLKDGFGYRRRSGRRAPLASNNKKRNGRGGQEMRWILR